MALRVKCPKCHAEAAGENNPHRPFCSECCQLIDLGVWAEERYRIPGSETKPSLDHEDNNGDKKIR